MAGVGCTGAGCGRGHSLASEVARSGACGQLTVLCGRMDEDMDGASTGVGLWPEGVVAERVTRGAEVRDD